MDMATAIDVIKLLAQDHDEYFATLDKDDEEKQFCAELVRRAYRMALGAMAAVLALEDDKK